MFVMILLAHAFIKVVRLFFTYVRNDFIRVVFGRFVRPLLEYIYI